MRSKLKQIGSEERQYFTATFERFGKKNGYMGQVETVLLINVMDESGKILTDHLWFNMTKGFKALNLEKGDKISFMGRVQKYQKGYFGYRKDVYLPPSTDYKISRLTQIKKLSDNDYFD